MTENSTGFGGRLKIALKANQMTIDGLSNDTGISVSGIKNWSRGHSEPNLGNLVTVAKALNVTVQWLATGEGEMRSGSTLPFGLEKATAAHNLGRFAPSAGDNEAASEDPFQPARDQIELISTLIEAMVALYKEENARITTIDLFKLAVAESQRIVAFTTKPKRWPPMVANVIDDLRDELRKPPIPGTVSKRRADRKSVV